MSETVLRNTVVIELKEPIPGHKGQVTHVTIREPRGRDYIEIGDPFLYARTENKMIVSAENDEAIKRYWDRCIVDPDPGVCNQLCLSDAMNVKDALLGFFRDARLAQSLSAASSS